MLGEYHCMHYPMLQMQKNGGGIVLHRQNPIWFDLPAPEIRMFLQLKTGQNADRRLRRIDPAVTETRFIRTARPLGGWARHAACPAHKKEKGALKDALSETLLSSNYSMIFETTPAPTVRPPSRMAKRRPSSIAIGAISSTSNFRLSPGITISVPSGRVTVPVTSVVRK